MSTAGGLCQNDFIYFIITDRFAGAGARHGKEGRGAKDLKHYYGGNFAGIAEKVPFLKHLGITALWITPVYLGIGAFRGDGGGVANYHGYCRWILSGLTHDCWRIKTRAAKKS